MCLVGIKGKGPKAQKHEIVGHIRTCKRMGAAIRLDSIPCNRRKLTDPYNNVRYIRERSLKYRGIQQREIRERTLKLYRGKAFVLD